MSNYPFTTSSFKEDCPPYTQNFSNIIEENWIKIFSINPGADGLALFMKAMCPPCWVIATATFLQLIILSTGIAEITNTYEKPLRHYK